LTMGCLDSTFSTGDPPPPPPPVPRGASYVPRSPNPRKVPNAPTYFVAPPPNTGPLAVSAPFSTNHVPCHEKRDTFAVLYPPPSVYFPWNPPHTPPLPAPPQSAPSFFSPSVSPYPPNGLRQLCSLTPPMRPPLFPPSSGSPLPRKLAISPYTSPSPWHRPGPVQLPPLAPRILPLWITGRPSWTLPPFCPSGINRLTGSYPPPPFEPLPDRVLRSLSP